MTAVRPETRPGGLGAYGATGATAGLIVSICHMSIELIIMGPRMRLRPCELPNFFRILMALTSKPIEPTPSTLKADLAVFVNSNMLITKIIGKNAQWLLDWWHDISAVRHLGSASFRQKTFRQCDNSAVNLITNTKPRRK